MNTTELNEMKKADLNADQFALFEQLSTKAIQCSSITELLDESLPLIQQQIHSQEILFAWKNHPQDNFNFESFPTKTNLGNTLLKKVLQDYSQITHSNNEFVKVLSEPESLTAILIFNQSVAGVIQFQFNQPENELHGYLGLIKSVAVLFTQTLRTTWLQQEFQTQLSSERKKMNRMLGQRLYPHHTNNITNAFSAIYDQIDQASQTNVPVFITGEPGVETERVAAAIHASSSCSHRSLITVHCSAHSESELDQRLFESDENCFDKAQGASLFINEIGLLPSTLQIKLHNVLTSKQYENVRVIAASTNKIEQLLSEDRFREDLYYQLKRMSMRIPPLRERKEEILTIAEQFVELTAKRRNKEIERIGAGAVQALLQYHWPGNVSELESCIDYAVKRADSLVIHARHLPLAVRVPSKDETNIDFSEQVNQLESDLLYEALKRTKGNISAAARDLGITARMVRYKVQKLDIPYEDLFKRKI